MAYFIFLKNSDNIEGTCFRIAENQSDLNNLNINQPDFKIIEDTQSNFNLVKYGSKVAGKYNGDNITYYDITVSFINEQILQNYVNDFKNIIKQFTNNNPNHPLFSIWNNYYNQLSNLNLNTIAYPLNKSLEQYFNDLGQTSLSPLQLP